MVTDTLTAVCKILLELERAMDFDDSENAQIDHDSLGITQERWNRCIEMLRDEGYIKCIITTVVRSTGVKRINVSGVRITLKGIDYLHNNPTMQKIARVVTDVITIVKP